MKYFPRLAALHDEGPSPSWLLSPYGETNDQVTLVSTALIAAAVFTTQAVATRSDAAAQHAKAKAHTVVTDCVRAPDVGAFASDPYTVPPCIPNIAADTFQ
jgi:hypothetical protein